MECGRALFANLFVCTVSSRPDFVARYRSATESFIPIGVQHKLEFVQQLMSDFPHMKFILIGDDGQQDQPRMLV